MAISVFLDTSIYENLNFSFLNKQFTKLKELTEKEEVILLYNDVVYQEVKQHIRDNITEAAGKFNQVIEENRAFAPFRNDELWKEHISLIDVDKMVASLQERWDLYLKECNAIKIPINMVDVDDIVSRYFNKRYPFENKKPYEFKDAIIIDSIRQYYDCVEDEEIYAVARDKGFRKALKEDEGIVPFSELNDALNSAIRNEENIALEVENQFETGKFDKEIEKRIDYIISTASLDVEDVFDDIDLISAKCLDIRYGYVHECDVDSASVVAEVDIEFVVEYDVRDEVNSYFDKEDDRYYWEEFITYRNTFIVTEEVEIFLVIESNEEKVETVIEYGDLDISADFYLRESEITESEIIKTTSNFDEEDEYDSSAEYCPDCGRKMTFETSAGAFCIDCAPNH